MSWDVLHLVYFGWRMDNWTASIGELWRNAFPNIQIDSVLFSERLNNAINTIRLIMYFFYFFIFFYSYYFPLLFGVGALVECRANALINYQCSFKYIYAGIADALIYSQPKMVCFSRDSRFSMGINFSLFVKQFFFRSANKGKICIHIRRVTRVFKYIFG